MNIRYRSEAKSMSRRLLSISPGPAVSVGSAGPLPFGSLRDARSDRVLGAACAFMEDLDRHLRRSGKKSNVQSTRRHLRSVSKTSEH